MNNWQKIKEKLCSNTAKTIYGIIFVVAVGVGLYWVHINRSQAREAVKPLQKQMENIYTGNSTIYEIKTSPDGKTDNKTRAVNNENVQSKFEAESKKVVKKDLGDNVIIYDEPSSNLLGAKQSKVLLAPVDLFPTSKTNKHVEVQGAYAPFGRKIRCQLATSVNSVNKNSPIIAQVMENLEWEGEVIIPAGVEVHTMISSSTSDRIVTNQKFKLIFPFVDDSSGYELNITGIALACDKTEDGLWGKDDGTAGIKGVVVDNSANIKMLATMATFVSGLGEGMVKTTTDYIGSTTEKEKGGDFQSALGTALQKSLERAATELLNDAKQAIHYVEVQAGTEFYIYTTQIIDVDDIKKGVKNK